ncbi:TPA: hypothetical protein EYP44_00465 [Candidatus Bathyarchaeota archaeon]|nr:hypothetical protein [Candidatus Bathyarchaeota archaeon]
MAIPRVLLGHNPFIGYSYLSEARAKEYRRRFSATGAIRELIAKSVHMGVPGVFISSEPSGTPLPTDGVIKAVEEASSETGVDIFVMSNMTGPEGDLERLSGVNLRVGVVHGSIIDAMLEGRGLSGLDEMLATIRDAGVVPGIVTHTCVNLSSLIADEHDIQIFVSPFNKLGWNMRPNIGSFLSALPTLTKPFFAIKPLAMGRISPEEGFRWVFEHDYVKGCAVGIATGYEMEEDYRILKAILEGERAPNRPPGLEPSRSQSDFRPLGGP